MNRSDYSTTYIREICLTLEGFTAIVNLHGREVLRFWMAGPRINAQEFADNWIAQELAK